MRLIPRTLEQIESPIVAAFALLANHTPARALINLSQAAPAYAAASPVVEAIQQAAGEADGGYYAPGRGLEPLRVAFAAELSQAYNGSVDAENVLITAGCNQAFTLLSSTIAAPGDRFILPVPYYFNHDMWLRLDGMEVDHLATPADLIPTVEDAAQLIRPETRAIVLVTPGNPSGAVMPADRIAAFADLARANDLALIIDETYRTFVPSGEAPHGLFARDDWADTVISLHSFSKEFAIPGHRVGAAVGAPALLDEALKLLDCVAICAPRSGQAAALAGLRHSLEWRSEQVARIAALQADFEAVMADRPGGWELTSAGAYFGWVRHPWDCSDQAAVQRLLFELDILAIPGAAFLPGDEGMIRMSFANLEPVEIEALGDRLRSV